MQQQARIAFRFQELMLEVAAKREEFLERLYVAICGLGINEARPALSRRPTIQNPDEEFATISVGERRKRFREFRR
nr:hypothetical protein [Bradyrhizobium sp. CCBAU 53380]